MRRRSGAMRFRWGGVGERNSKKIIMEERERKKDETETVRERFQRSVSCIGKRRRITEKMCIVVQEACALRKNMPVYEYEQTSTAMQ